MAFFAFGGCGYFHAPVLQKRRRRRNRPIVFADIGGIGEEVWQFAAIAFCRGIFARAQYIGNFAAKALCQIRHKMQAFGRKKLLAFRRRFFRLFLLSAFGFAFGNCIS